MKTNTLRVRHVHGGFLVSLDWDFGHSQEHIFTTKEAMLEFISSVEFISTEEVGAMWQAQKAQGINLTSTQGA